MFMRYFNLVSRLRKRIQKIPATMALRDITDIYAENVCELNGWKKYQGYTCLSDQYVEISFAYMNGYIKAINDNGFEFKEGLVKPIDPNIDSLGGDHKPYDEKIRNAAQKAAINTLRTVLSKYERSLNNINLIVNDFEKALNEE